MEMIMKTTGIVRVKFRWWVTPYLGLCRLGVALGLPINIDHVAATTVGGVLINARRSDERQDIMSAVVRIIAARIQSLYQ